MNPAQEPDIAALLLELSIWNGSAIAVKSAEAIKFLQSALLALQGERDQARRSSDMGHEVIDAADRALVAAKAELDAAERERDAAIKDAERARADALEQAAKVCEETGRRLMIGGDYSESSVEDECAAAIRALIPVKDAE